MKDFEVVPESQGQNLAVTVLCVPYSLKTRWFRGGLIFKAHRLLYHSTLGWRGTNEKEEESGWVRFHRDDMRDPVSRVDHHPCVEALSSVKA